jgi:hypothetical protein
MKNPTMSMADKAANGVPPTLKERIVIYEKLLHDLHFYTNVSPEPKIVKALLAKVSRWSNACQRVSVTEDAVTINKNYADAQRDAVEDYIKIFWDMDKR